MTYLKRSLFALAMVIGGSAYLGAGIDPADDMHLIGGGVWLLFGLFCLAVRFEQTHADGVREGQEMAASVFQEEDIPRSEKTS